MQTGFFLPQRDFEFNNPFVISSMLFPFSISITSQPKASNLHLILPIGRTSSVAPSICFPFKSTVAIRLSIFLAEAYIIASQFWPSCNSPSPIST